MAGEFHGIGAELGLKENKIVVVSPLSESPAIKAGVKPEDVILKVDGTSTQGWSIAQAVEKIRGPKGTLVTLNIQHKNEKSPKDIRIPRDVITVKSIDGDVKKIKDVANIKISDKLKSSQDDEIMYLRLTQFGDHTNKDWNELMTRLSLKVTANKNSRE